MKTVALALLCLGASAWATPLFAQEVRALIDKGNAAYATGLFGVAAAAYREALAVDHASAVARENLGLSLFRAGQIPQSLDALTEAAALFHSSADQAAARYNLGTVLAAAGRLDEALEEYRHSLRLADREDSRRNYALLLARRQDASGAQPSGMAPARADELRQAARRLQVAVVGKTTVRGQVAIDR